MDSGIDGCDGTADSKDDDIVEGSEEVESLTEETNLENNKEKISSNCPTDSFCFETFFLPGALFSTARRDSRLRMWAFRLACH